MLLVPTVAAVVAPVAVVAATAFLMFGLCALCWRNGGGHRGLHVNVYNNAARRENWFTKKTCQVVTRESVQKCFLLSGACRPSRRNRPCQLGRELVRILPWMPQAKPTNPCPESSWRNYRHGQDTKTANHVGERFLV